MIEHPVSAFRASLPHPYPRKLLLILDLPTVAECCFPPQLTTPTAAKHALIMLFYYMQRHAWIAR